MDPFADDLDQIIEINDSDPNQNQSTKKFKPKHLHNGNEPVNNFINHTVQRSSSSSSSTAAQPVASNNEDNNTINIIEHRLTIDEIYEKYDTTIVNGGLSEREALKRLQLYGLNTFTPPKTKSWFVLLLKEMFTGFAILLWIAGIISFVSYFIKYQIEDVYLGGALIFTVLVTGFFSYYQQMSSSAVFNSFKQMTPQNAIVLRDGRKQEILAEQLVIGDIVYCNAGDRIPADIRIVHSDNMKIDNSSITGESKPLLRTIGPCKDNQSYLEASNLAFFSTNCTDGNGIGVVIRTGDNTVIGDLASNVSNIGEQTTPIAREISFFVNIITAISIVSGAIIFGLTIYFGETIFNSFILMIGVIVGNVPEGLLPALTVVLTVAAKRMASKNCMVKHLEAVETLGSTSVICTDKTGTLTQNRMTIEHIWFDGENSYQNREQKLFLNGKESKQFEQGIDWLTLKRCAMLCSRAEFLDDNPIIKNRKTFGDASETAIMKFLEESFGSVKEYRQLYPKVAEKPFNSTTKYQFSIHKQNNPNTGLFSNYFLVMKGAPEKILQKCNRRINEEGKTILIDDQFINSFENIYRNYGSNGERVLAFCDCEYTKEQFDENYSFDGVDLDEIIQLKNLRFLGLMSMIDPPRPDVPNAVQQCRRAGIRVVMITGDHPITAQAIAKMCNIISVEHRSMSISSLASTTSVAYNNQRSIVIPGNELEEMSDDELRSVLQYDEIVFARTSPKQKFRVVEQFQIMGEIVAVTGDGVNDSLALKKADIGISMGITGSEVSKQAADMILLDDNFATIVVGIEEGRRIFDNLKKTISYILAGNVTTIYPFILYAIIGIPLAISTPTALLIALGTDMAPAISLAYEKCENDIMNIGPRNSKKDRMVDGKLLQRAYLTVGIMISSAAFFLYFVTMWNYGYEPIMLINSQLRWNNHNNTFPRIDFKNSTWQHKHYINTTWDERKAIQIEAQSAYFTGIIVMQWFDVIVCKTRRVSIFRHGMSNWVLNFSILFETAIAALFIYLPALNRVMQLHSVDWRTIVWAFPFPFLMLFYEEIRKWIIRQFPTSFLGKELLA